MVVKYRSEIRRGRNLTKPTACLLLFGFAETLPVLAEWPKGWKMRIDRSMSAADPDNSGAIRFVWTNPGFHAMNPQAAVYWNPLNTLKGTYTVKATFTLEQPSPHT